MSSSVAAAPCAPSPTAVRLAALLVAAWFAATAPLLWHFERQRLADQRQLAHFDVDHVPPPPLAAPAGAAKILYFLDPGCRCNAAAVAELGRLRRALLLPAAQFAFAPADALPGGGVQALTAAERSAWRGHVPATPAAALWDARGRLIYFGPIVVNAGCGDGASYLHDALRTMRTDSSAAFASWDVVTCACQRASSFHS